VNRFFLFGFLLISSAASAIPSRTQWSLRFKSSTGYASAEMGCYGTASYHYILPDVAILRAHRQALWEEADKLGLRGLAWTGVPDPAHPEHILAVDLASGQLVSLPELAYGEEDRALVFCLCRYTAMHHCTPQPLPALGRPFFSSVVTVEPE